MLKDGYASHVPSESFDDRHMYDSVLSVDEPSADHFFWDATTSTHNKIILQPLVSNPENMHKIRNNYAKWKLSARKSNKCFDFSNHLAW